MSVHHCHLNLSIPSCSEPVSASQARAQYPGKSAYAQGSVDDAGVFVKFHLSVLFKVTTIAVKQSQ